MNTDLTAGDLVYDYEKAETLVVTLVTSDYMEVEPEKDAHYSYRYYDASTLEKTGTVSRKGHLGTSISLNLRQSFYDICQAQGDDPADVLAYLIRAYVDRSWV